MSVEPVASPEVGSGRGELLRGDEALDLVSESASIATQYVQPN
jgi:hypothetical protein